MRASYVLRNARRGYFRHLATVVCLGWLLVLVEPALAKPYTPVDLGDPDTTEGPKQGGATTKSAAVAQRPQSEYSFVCLRVNRSEGPWLALRYWTYLRTILLH